MGTLRTLFDAAHSDDAVLLHELSTHKNVKVRCAVASNRNTPPETLIVLCDDCEVSVVRCVAGNPAAPVEALQAICDEPSSPTTLSHFGVSLSHELLGNRNVPQSIIECVRHNGNYEARVQAEFMLRRLAGADSDELDSQTDEVFNMVTAEMNQPGKT